MKVKKAASAVAGTFAASDAPVAFVGCEHWGRGGRFTYDPATQRRTTATAKRDVDGAVHDEPMALTATAAAPEQSKDAL